MFLEGSPGSFFSTSDGVNIQLASEPTGSTLGAMEVEASKDVSNVNWHGTSGDFKGITTN